MNPSFVLAGPDGVVLAEGMRTGFADIADAQAALRSGRQ
ncbi:isochorismate synthase family protein [Mycolicibacterium fortuitum]|uniref:Isochorismate synthase family protein n=1 Tax=Mycolicibacterium fortuitum TaxID=1766 RepID=A0A378U8A7_MYCFO|nr:isochorismate synthase family protein [Mycolicibacterium fortuitum]